MTRTFVVTWSTDPNHVIPYYEGTHEVGINVPDGLSESEIRQRAEAKARREIARKTLLSERLLHISFQ